MIVEPRYRIPKRIPPILPQEPGLVGYWDFSLKQHPDTIYDRSGEGNNGTRRGASWVVGRFGYVLNFDGVDDYVDCGNSDSLDSPLQYTYSAWIYPKVLLDYKAIIVHRKSGLGAVVGLWTSGSSLYIEVYNDDRSSKVSGSAHTLSLNTWQHVALTIDASGNVKLWLNGESAIIGVVSGPFTNYDTPLCIGVHSSIQYFFGLIAEVRIYNRALSATEIARLYAGTHRQIAGK